MLERVGISWIKFLGAVFNFHYNDHTNSFFKSNLIFELNDLYKLNVSTSRFTYPKYSTIHTEFVSSCMSFNSVKHEYQTRTSNNISVIRFNRTASQSSYAYKSIKKTGTFCQRVSKIIFHQPVPEPNLKFIFVLNVKVYSIFYYFTHLSIICFYFILIFQFVIE